MGKKRRSVGNSPNRTQDRHLARHSPKTAVGCHENRMPIEKGLPCCKQRKRTIFSLMLAARFYNDSLGEQPLKKLPKQADIAAMKT
jgi:hypothetical protein